MKTLIQKIISKIKDFLNSKRGKNILQGLEIAFEYAISYVALTLFDKYIINLNLGDYTGMISAFIPLIKNTIVQYNKKKAEDLAEKIKQDSFIESTEDNMNLSNQQ